MKFFLKILLFIPFRIHSAFVALKYQQAKAEALQLIFLIEDKYGCDSSEAKRQRIEHLCEHYKVTHQELDLINSEDLSQRALCSLARAQERKRKTEEEYLLAMNPPPVKVPLVESKVRPPIRICA
ncbi:MAG: hypothetical protein PHG25_00495 [Candidatus Pacebacteria bacterium]|nr:hypothetical protein [Candidatus Paceibacterota bacterium]